VGLFYHLQRALYCVVWSNPLANNNGAFFGGGFDLFFYLYQSIVVYQRIIQSKKATTLRCHNVCFLFRSSDPDARMVDGTRLREQGENVSTTPCGDLLFKRETTCLVNELARDKFDYGVSVSP